MAAPHMAGPHKAAPGRTRPETSAVRAGGGGADRAIAGDPFDSPVSLAFMRGNECDAASSYLFPRGDLTLTLNRADRPVCTTPGNVNRWSISHVSRTLGHIDDSRHILE